MSVLNLPPRDPQGSPSSVHDSALFCSVLCYVAPHPLPRLPEASMCTLCSVNDRGNFIRAIEFNYPFLESSEDVRLTARHLPEAPGAHLLKRSVCGAFRAWVFTLLPPTSRDSAPFPTAKHTSNPAGFWAWILGRESQSWELSKVFILIMFPFILFFVTYSFILNRTYDQVSLLPSSIIEFYVSLSYFLKLD